VSLAYLETMRSFILAAEAKPLRAASGLALPDPALAWAARVALAKRLAGITQA